MDKYKLTEMLDSGMSMNDIAKKREKKVSLLLDIGVINLMLNQITPHLKIVLSI